MEPAFLKNLSASCTAMEMTPAAMQDAGIAYAVEQIVDLISNGVQGIHLYTMNNPLIAHRINQAVASLIRCSNR